MIQRPRILYSSIAAACCLAAQAAISPPSIAAAPHVYECRQGGTRILADRPCGEDSSLRAVDLRELNRYTPVPLPAPTATPRTPRKAGKPEVGRRETRSCREIQDEIDRIDSRMRLGYTGKVGEKLRAQRGELKDRYASQRCNTTSRQPAS